MHEPSFVQRFLRERALSRYLAALERGDIDTVITVLELSARDGALEQMIFDLHETYQTEEEFLEMVQDLQNEPDLVEVERGVFKSRLEGKLPEPRRARRPRRLVFERVLQLVAAVTLIACVLGSVVLLTGFPAIPKNTQVGSLAKRCLSSGAPLSPDEGMPVFSQIVALSAQDMWIVGNLRANYSSLRSQPLLEHWDGARWSEVPGANIQNLLQSNSNWNSASLFHMAVLSRSNIWAVGGVGAYKLDAFSGAQEIEGMPLIEHWDGWQWQLVGGAAGISERYSVLNDLVAFSADDIYAAGFSSDTSISQARPLLEHWDGTRWSLVHQPDLFPQINVLDRISATSANDIWALGRPSPLFQSFPVLEHWNGQRWNSTSLRAAGLGTATSLVALSANDVWVAGNSPLVYPDQTAPLLVHWDGRQWSQVASGKELGSGSLLLGLKVKSDRDIWIAGSTSNQHSLLVHWDGQSWSPFKHQSPPFAYFTDLAHIGGHLWSIGGTYRDSFEQDIAGALIETGC